MFKYKMSKIFAIPRSFNQLYYNLFCRMNIRYIVNYFVELPPIYTPMSELVNVAYILKGEMCCSGLDTTRFRPFYNKKSYDPYIFST